MISRPETCRRQVSAFAVRLRPGRGTIRAGKTEYFQLEGENRGQIVKDCHIAFFRRVYYNGAVSVNELKKKQSDKKE